MKIAGEKNIINKLISGELYDAARNKKIRLPIKKLIIARNALEKILAIFDDTKFARHNISVAIVSDFITHDVAGAAIERALAKKYSITSIILPEGVKADEESLHEVFCLSHGCKFIVAVGSGTINDLCKMASFKHGIDYGVFATAPSMNGYLSPTASIELGGVKTSIKAHMPKLAVFDLDVLSNAPKQLILSGLGDAICRSTVQADCLLSHYLLGTQYNKFIFDLLLEAENNLLPEVKNLCKKGKNTKAILALTNSLIVGGIAMWMSGSSTPASQGEHMICHYMESFFNDGAYNNLFANKQKNFHGEEVGVATLYMAKLQESFLKQKMLKIKPNALSKKEYSKFFDKQINAQKLDKFYKEYKAKMISEEVAEELNKFLQQNWQNIKTEILQNFLNHSQILDILNLVGSKTKISDLGWFAQNFEQATKHAYLTRNRFTFMDLQ
jgi:glycerol-1-phosphate dehydrogenase [NAD(P)+]